MHQVVPDHAPLEACPFCGREASVTAYQPTPTSPIQWSVGCWQMPDLFSRAAHWEDCPGPTTLWISLEKAVEQWNRRA